MYGNNFYSGIKSFGTPSALEPGFISQAKMVGPYSLPKFPNTFNEKVLDINVDISNTLSSELATPLGGKAYILGDYIPAGSVITYVSIIREEKLLEANTSCNFSLATPDLSVSEIPNTPPIVAQLIPVRGVDLNGGKIYSFDSNTGLVGPSLTTFVPILLLTNIVTSPVPIGSIINVKVKYITLP